MSRADYDNVVEDRKRMKHRKRRRAINEPGHAHFLTYSCRERLPLLSKDRSRQWVIDALAAMRCRLNVAIIAYVIMPEHVHVLLVPADQSYEMRRILAALKAPVARHARMYLEQCGASEWLQRLTVSRQNRTSFQFWQTGGGYDQNLWNSRPIQAVIDYIHANPVRRGLVTRPTDWAWSSARAHAGLPDVLLETDSIDIGS